MLRVAESATQGNRGMVLFKIKAGSLAETEEERGFAHLLEHLCVSGALTEDGEKWSDVLQQHGITVGQHLNATTSPGETLYHVIFDGSDLDQVELVLRYLRTIASEIEISQERIDRELSIIEEEEAVTSGPDPDQKRLIRALFSQGQDSRLNVLGDLTQLESASAADLTQFYQTWYRADLAELTIIIPDQMEAALADAADLFSTWQPSGPTPTWSNLQNTNGLGDIRFTVLPETPGNEDKVIVGRSVDVPLTASPESAWAYRAVIETLNEHLDAEHQPWESATLQLVNISDSQYLLVCTIQSEDDSLDEAVSTLASYLHPESMDLDAVKETLARLLEAQKREGELPDVRALAASIMILGEGAFVEAIPGNDLLTKAYQTLMGGQGWIAYLPDELGVESLQQAWETGRSRPIEPLPSTRDLASVFSLPAALDSPDLPEGHETALGTVYSFGEGLDVRTLRDDRHGDQVIVTLAFEGGRSGEDGNNLGASVATGYGLHSPEFDALSSAQVKQFLKTNQIQPTWLVLDDHILYQLTLPTSQLEVAMAFLHRLIEESRLSEAAFEKWKIKAEKMDDSIESQAGIAGYWALQKLKGQGDPRFLALSKETAQELTLQEAKKYYRKELKSAALSVSIVGNVKEKTALRLAGRAFAGRHREPFTPGQEVKESIAGTTQTTVKIENAERSSLTLWIPVKSSACWDNAQFESAASLLTDLLRSELRDQQQLVYSVMVRASTDRIGSETRGFMLQVLTKPENLARAESIIARCIDQLIQGSLPDSLLHNATARQITNWTIQSDRLEMLGMALARQSIRPQALMEQTAMVESLHRLSADDLRKWMQSSIVQTDIKKVLVVKSSDTAT